jgi:hypothetical protein
MIGIAIALIVCSKQYAVSGERRVAVKNIGGRGQGTVWRERI